ncbi:hypothetical protein CsSME_00012383 [Camellia sinensis var. sinensis]
MEGFEFDAPPPYTAADEINDFCNSILTRFSSSTEDHHHRLCVIIGAMSQELKDQPLLLTPVAYFGATCSSLDRLSAEAEPPSHVVAASETNEHRLGPVVTSHNDLGVTWQNRELFFAAISTTLQLRKSAIDGTLHSFFSLAEDKEEK